MKEFEVRIKNSAFKELSQLPSNLSNLILSKITDLATNPYPIGCKKLIGFTDFWRLRINNYRIIYSINDKILKIEVIKIRHRRDVYR